MPVIITAIQHWVGGPASTVSKKAKEKHTYWKKNATFIANQVKDTWK